MPSPPRPRGRPRADREPLTLARIVLVAAALLEREGARALTMRRIATALRVDPMALYHHVPSREALLAAIAEQRLAVLDPLTPPFREAQGWRARLLALAAAYLAAAGDAPELVRALAASEEAVARTAGRFHALVALALEELDLSPRQLGIATALLADFVHGFALAPPPRDPRAFEEELAMLALGIEASMRRGPAPR